MTSTDGVLAGKTFNRRRLLAKTRKHRMHMLVPRMGLAALMACGLVGFSSIQQRWSEESAAWSELGEESSLVNDAPGMSSFGFGDLSLRERKLTSVVAPVVCPATGPSNSTFPKMDIEPMGAAITVEVILVLWMFLGLAIVCDSFFESALSRICEAMNLKDDVAGATWMAAGGSAPELATSILGVFVSRSDVGFGTIVGSAVFNVLFVIACCAFVAPNLKLTWWPLARDCAFYCFSMAILVFVISDLKVWWYEALILLFLYGGYVAVMYFNERLEIWVTGRVRIAEQAGNPLQRDLLKLLASSAFGVVLYATIFANSAVIGYEFYDDDRRARELPCVCGERVGIQSLAPSGAWWANLGFNIFFIIEMLMKWYAYGFFGYWKQPLNCFDGSLVFLIIIEFILTASAGSERIGIGAARSLRVLRFVRLLYACVCVCVRGSLN